MDFVNKLTGASKEEQEKKPQDGEQKESGGGFMGKLNSMAGGGKESEKNEDALDKGLYIGIAWIHDTIFYFPSSSIFILSTPQISSLYPTNSWQPCRRRLGTGARARQRRPV